MFHQERKSHSGRWSAAQSGVTLVELIVALAIVTILLLGVGQAVRGFLQADKNLDQMMEEESIRNLIRAKMDCATTLAGIVPGRNIILRDRKNLPITAADSSGNMLVGSGTNQWVFTVPIWNIVSGAFTINVTPPKKTAHTLFKKAPVICK